MAKLKKTMCKYGKDDWKEKEDLILAEVIHPRYLCRKCMRVATDKKRLCNPEKLPEE